jgi:FAD/FMN-containing dehydrogenase
VVKSVAGYDIHKLQIGALGTLGIIIGANFKTFPLPQAQATFVVRFPDAAGALNLRSAVGLSQLQPRAMDIVSPEAARYLRHADAAKAAHLDVPVVDWEDTQRYVGAEKAAEYKRKYDEAAALAKESIADAAAGPAFSEREWTVVVATGGNERVVERHCRELEEMATQAGASAFAETKPDDSPEGCEEWRWIRSFPDCVRRFAPSAALVKVTALPTSFPAVLAATRQASEKNDLPHATLVRAAGVVYCAFAPRDNDDAAVTELAATCEDFFSAVRKTGASGVVELCPVALKRKLNIWGVPRGEIELMRRLKKEFDPAGILSPGRMMGL